MAADNVAWVGRAPRTVTEPELIDPETGRAPRSQVGRRRAEQAAADAEAARVAAEAEAAAVTADAPPPDTVS